MKNTISRILVFQGYRYVAVMGMLTVKQGIGLFPYLMCVNRSSSAAANNFPFLSKQAEESWKTALIPNKYIT